MSKKLQSTSFRKNVSQVLIRLETWSENPWRRYSLFLIIFLTGFVFGSSIGTINGGLALMDPIGAFFVVVILEVMVRLRRNWPKVDGAKISLQLIDVARIGLLYGLLLEGFKLFG